MATFTWNYSVLFTPNIANGDPLDPASTFSKLIEGPATQPITTIDDGNANDPDVFEPADTLIVTNGDTITPNTATATYIGTIEINSETFILVEQGGTYLGYAFVPDATIFNTGIAQNAQVASGSDIQDTTSVDPDTVCFAAGTRIATPTGDARVEDLVIGTLVLTAEGHVTPVKWIGRQTVQKIFAGERARPVRVSAGALGDGLPHSDLVLTAEHALILDGLAINAGALVNGTTITLEPLSALPDRVTYYHVETEAHDVILANGAPAETFVDYVGRQAFDNHAEYVALYGDAHVIAEMPLPRISTARLVPPSLKARLAGRDVA